MGPRLFSRGNFPITWNDVNRRWWLQWGRGFSAAETSSCQPTRRRRTSRFNGAAAFQPRKRHGGGTCRSTWHVSLQWGRGFSAAETGRGLSLLLSLLDAASMGPRLFSRGNVSGSDLAPSRASRFNGAAAFQPRKHGASRPTRFQANVWLQWGRGFSAAETCAPIVNVFLALGRLQWGRGFSAAETGLAAQ